MKITRRDLRTLIESIIIEGKEKFKKVKGGKRKAIKVAKYGDPKKRADLKDFLVEKFGKIEYCKTCAAYDVSDAAVEAGVTEKDRSIAFCHAYGFSCAATNSCTSYTPGGPKKS